MREAAYKAQELGLNILSEQDWIDITTRVVGLPHQTKRPEPASSMPQYQHQFSHAPQDEGINPLPFRCCQQINLNQTSVHRHKGLHAQNKDDCHSQDAAGQ